MTAHLAHKGFVAPELVRTADGRLLADVDGARWRLSTRVPGATHARANRLDRVDQTARALGRFHRAIADVEHVFLITFLTLVAAMVGIVFPKCGSRGGCRRP